jgi:hypothetical protein
MSKTVLRGLFYEFDRARFQREVGDVITEVKARLRLRNGGDVYTLFKEDAYKLATSAYSGPRPVLEGGHEAGYFSHYHPGGVHPVYVPGHPKARDTPGHIFFGARDEKWSAGLHGSPFRRS